MVEVTGSDGSSFSFGYDANNNSSKIDEKVGGSTFSTSFTYDKDNKLKEVLFGGDKKSTNTYDAIGRLTEKSIYTGSTTYSTTNSTTIGYKAGVNGSSTTQIASISNNGNNMSYTYDANGNIETITENGKVIKYNYDELNEVMREDNQELNKTITYSYDAGGNITSKSEYPYTIGTVGTSTKTYNYSYGDSNWKDLLTRYEDKDITYDEIGNLKTYNGYTYTWEAGRQLKGISGNGNTISYKYNDSGIRTQKTIGNVTTKYYLSGDKVTYESNGIDNIHYTYDSSDNLVSMNLNGTEYYYIRNAQSDIIGLIDGNGTQIASYTYDTWGKLISIKDQNENDMTNDTSSVGYKNPYRYRGYRYDTETGLYYLQSRYYNPEWGRFINADALGGQVGSLLSHNIFAYCQNNVVNMADPSGFVMICMADGCSGVSNNIGISKSSENKSKNNKKKAYSQKTFWHETSKPSISKDGISVGSVTAGIVELDWNYELKNLGWGMGVAKINAAASFSNQMVGIFAQGGMIYFKVVNHFTFRNKQYDLVQEFTLLAVGGGAGYNSKRHKAEIGISGGGFGYDVSIEGK